MGYQCSSETRAGESEKEGWGDVGGGGGDLLKLLVLAVEGEGEYGGMKGSISWVGRAGNNGAGTGWGEQK